MTEEKNQSTPPLSPERCPLANKSGDTICIDGQLWSLTYNECAPPDQRQCMGPCSWNGHCRRKGGDFQTELVGRNL
jgi:hypothetical protein